MRIPLFSQACVLAAGASGVLLLSSLAAAAPIELEPSTAHFQPPSEELIDFGDGFVGLPRVHTDVPDLPRPELPPMQLELPDGLPKLNTPYAQQIWLELPENDLSDLFTPGQPPVLHTDLPDLPDLIRPEDLLLGVGQGVYARGVLPLDGGAYTLRAVPAPGPIAILTLSCLVMGRTRRRG